jgi:GntR family transcriptional regulator
MKTLEKRIKTDSRPLYNQAIDALNRYIELAGLKPGDRLPGEDDLARQLGISRPTLREAMGALECHGIIDRRHGVGTFVTAPVRGSMQGGLEKLESVYSLATDAGIEAKRDDWIVEPVTAVQEVAGNLEVIPGDMVIHVQVTIMEKNRHFVFMSSFVKPAFVDLTGLKNFKHGSLLDYLIQKDEARLSYTNTHLFSVSADQEIARWLHITENHPLLLLEETFFSEVGEPVVWTKNYFITDTVNFHLIRRIVRP